VAYTDKVSGGLTKLLCLADTGKIYSTAVGGGGTTFTTTEYTNANYYINRFIIMGGVAYACANEGGVHGLLLKRNVVSDGAGVWTITWAKVNSQGRLGQANLSMLASDGNVYSSTMFDNALYRLSVDGMVGL